MQHVGDVPLDIDMLCWNAPLWANPLFAVPQQWEWYGQARQVVVGLEYVVAPGLLNLPLLQSLGQAVLLLSELERVCSLRGLTAQRTAYEQQLWWQWFSARPQYADRQLAVQHVQQLLAYVPAAWVAAAKAYLRNAQAAGHSPLVLRVADAAAVQHARTIICADLGWQQPGTTPGMLRLCELTVALATRLQQLTAHDAIAPRHAAFLMNVCTLDALPAHTQLPTVQSVLSRWWRLRVANTYKEAAWRLTLDAFPTAQRMHNNTPCAACGALGPGVTHHFWSCPVAAAVRHEVESQLIAFGFLPAGANLPCSAIWLACKPHVGMHRLVWDMVCIAVIHAFERGRRAAWAVSDQLSVPVLVEQVAMRSAVAAFWEALADFAATTKVPSCMRTAALTHQPFLFLHVVLVRGSGLRVVRR
jgi:hypothetical protein